MNSDNLLRMLTFCLLAYLSGAFVAERTRTSRITRRQRFETRIRQSLHTLQGSQREDEQESPKTAFYELDQLLSSSNRRSFLQLITTLASTAAIPGSPALAATSSPTSNYVVPTPAFTSDVNWPLGKVAFSLLPLAGTSTRRATVEETIVPNQIWTHDQLQGIVNVNVPVRQTVIKLKDGGLWVHNPVAPTPQLMDFMKSLEQDHGPVKHIVLGSVALEHKATFGAFCRKYPKATVWVQVSCLLTDLIPPFTMFPLNYSKWVSDLLSL